MLLSCHFEQSALSFLAPLVIDENNHISRQDIGAMKAAEETAVEACCSPCF